MENNNNKLISNIVNVWLIVVFFVVAILFTVQTQNIVLNKTVTVTITGFFLFFLWLANCIETGNYSLPKTPMTLPIVVFSLVIFLISTLRSPFKYYSIEEVSRYLSYLMVIIALLQFTDTVKKVEILVYSIFIITALPCIYALRQIFNLDFIPWGMTEVPYVSTFGNKNFFAGYLVVVTPIVMSVILIGRNMAVKMSAFVLFILCAFHVFFSGNRSSIIGLVAEIAFFIIFSIRFGFLDFCLKKIRLFFITIIVTFLILGSVVLSAMAMSSYITIRLKSIFQMQFGTNLVRVKMWTGASRMLREKPLMGQGTGTFQLTFPPKRPWDYNRSGVSHNTMHSHNDYNEYYSENGITGISIFWWLHIAYFIFTIHMLLTVKNKFIRNMQIGLLCGVLGFLVENIMSVNFRWTAPALNAWFVLGLSGALSLSARTHGGFGRSLKLISGKNFTPNNNPVRFIIYLVFTGIFIYKLYFSFILIKSDYYLKRGMNIVDQGGNPPPAALSEAESWLKKSINLYPYDLSSFYKLGFVYLMQGQSLLQSNNHILGMQLLEKALAMYNEIIKIAPNYAQIHNNIAMLYQQFGRYYQFRNMPLESAKNDFEAVRQFEWATMLENNEKNQQNLIQNYAQQKYNNFGQAFYHGWLLKEIARDEKKRALGAYFYDAYNHEMNNNLGVFCNTQINSYNAQVNAYSESMRMLSSFRFQKGDLKSAVNWILLSIDQNENQPAYKLTLVEYLTKHNRFAEFKNFFAFWEKNQQGTDIRNQLFSEIINLLIKYDAGVKDVNEKAEIKLYMEKCQKLIVQRGQVMAAPQIMTTPEMIQNPIIQAR